MELQSSYYTGTVFDTHAFVKKLTKAGMPEKQAEALAEEQTALIEIHLARRVELSLLRINSAKTCKCFGVILKSL